MAYGQGEATMQQQQSAPMAGPNNTSSSSAQNPMEALLPALTPLTSPSERPGEPVATGMDFGDGAGSEALNLPRERSLSEILYSMIDIDPTEEVEELYNFVLSRGL